MRSIAYAELRALRVYMIARTAVAKMKHLAQASATKLKEMKMPATGQPTRIDTFLAAPEYFHLSRTQAQKLIDNGDVFVNGTSVLKKSMHVKPNDSVSVALVDLPPTQQSTKSQQPATTKPQLTKKVVQKEESEKDDEVEEDGANADSADANGEGVEADELEVGPSNTTDPLITPIDILSIHLLIIFSLPSHRLFITSLPNTSTSHSHLIIPSHLTTPDKSRSPFSMKMMLY